MRRALELVADDDDPLLAAVLKGSVSWHLLVSGRFDEAERVAARTAASIEPRGDVPEPALSVYGSVLVQLANAAARGRQPKLSAKQQAELRRMHTTGDYSITDLADLFSVSRPTVYRTLQAK